MTFKNLFLPLLGMLVVYHRAEMESPFKDVTACLLKRKVDDRLKGFAASRAVTESLVQLWSPNNCAASTSCPEPSQPWGSCVKGGGVSCARAESSVVTGATGENQGCGCGQVTLGGTGSSFLHTCWLTLPSKTTEQRVVWKQIQQRLDSAGLVWGEASPALCPARGVGAPAARP